MKGHTVAQLNKAGSMPPVADFARSVKRFLSRRGNSESDEQDNHDADNRYVRP